MDPPNNPSSSSSMQLLTRHQNPPPKTPPQDPSSQNVVVIGFIGGQTPSHVTQLINRILDNNVFGSGNLDKDLFSHNNNNDKNNGGLSLLNDEVKNWLNCYNIKYYHEEEKGLLFLHFSSANCPVRSDGEERKGLEDSESLDSVVDECEFGELQGMLFMFTVCHIIVYIQEGSRFDTQVLRKIRVLQAAKHALAPSIRSRTTSSGSLVPSSSFSQPSVSSSSSNNPSPGRTGGISSHSSSSISRISGLGFYSSLFPGHCTPVILFVFIDDFLDIKITSSTTEDSTDNSSVSQTSSSGSLVKPGLPVKGSGSVVMLARPVSKSEGVFRKKLQSSLEAQIRFLIKKCRVLTGAETSHVGSRGGGGPSADPLFSLDTSRAVALVERSANQRGKSLEFACSLVEDVLNGKATSDSLLHESQSQNASQEDILPVKEFIYRQCDTLKGRGGLVGGSAAGVGMVAVAAAAAAASASSGKSFSTPGPDLPKIEIWLNSSQLILQGLLSAKRGCIDDTEVSKRKPRQKNPVQPAIEVNATKTTDPLNIAISRLESGRGINTRFSTLWCQRALPAATEVYLKDLPVCYPTLEHEAHLQKALNAFHSMVRGPAVPRFAKKLEDDCTSIWVSGRQLCDGVSLTGKPCMHQRHDLKLHSSGFFFLHACACGRSRKLRSDPFDFETANSTTTCFMECDKLLASLQLPRVSDNGPIHPSSWSLIRIGGSVCYDPSKGLLQSGFCSTQKFLLKFTIFLEKHKNPKYIQSSDVQQGFVTKSSTDFRVSVDGDIKKASAAESSQGVIKTGFKNKTYLSLSSKSDKKEISFGRVLSNFTMRKPFSEVVAGTAAADSGFPPLQQRKQKTVSSLQRGLKPSSNGNTGNVHIMNALQESEKHENSFDQRTLNALGSNGGTEGEPLLQIGSNVFPVTIIGGGKTETNTSPKHVTAYVGFEHECPHGHRFILTSEHLDALDSAYQLSKESHMPLPNEKLDSKSAVKVKYSKNSGHGKFQRQSNGNATAAANKMSNLDRSKEIKPNGNPHLDGPREFSVAGKEQNLTSIGMPSHFPSLEESFQYVNLDDGGSAFSLLNRNLPIYMHCPHCRVSKQKKDPQNIKFAGSISQLQRIFLVTPPFPVVLVAGPIVQFEASCLPPSIPDREQRLKFSFGCQVILPPESLLTLRLPFIYGVHLEDKSSHPLNPFKHQPELTAWIIKGTMLQVMYKGSGNNDS